MPARKPIARKSPGIPPKEYFNSSGKQLKAGLGEARGVVRFAKVRVDGVGRNTRKSFDSYSKGKVIRGTGNAIAVVWHIAYGAVGLVLGGAWTLGRLTIGGVLGLIGIGKSARQGYNKGRAKVQSVKKDMPKQSQNTNEKKYTPPKL